MHHLVSSSPHNHNLVFIPHVNKDWPTFFVPTPSLPSSINLIQSQLHYHHPRNSPSVALDTNKNHQTFQQYHPHHQFHRHTRHLGVSTFLSSPHTFKVILIPALPEGSHVRYSFKITACRNLFQHHCLVQLKDSERRTCLLKTHPIARNNASSLHTDYNALQALGSSDSDKNSTTGISLSARLWNWLVNGAKRMRYLTILFAIVAFIFTNRTPYDFMHTKASTNVNEQHSTLATKSQTRSESLIFPSTHTITDKPTSSSSSFSSAHSFSSILVSHSEDAKQIPQNIIARTAKSLSNLSKTLADQILHIDLLRKLDVPTWDTLVVLVTTMLVVPIMRRLNTSPILGFLVAGVLLGPTGIGIIHDVHGSKMLAEFGVVFFLFEMGLELSTQKLKSLSQDVFGLGTPQFFITMLLITVLSVMAGLPVETGIVIGGSFALSSSAFVLQLLSERSEVGTKYGRASLGILLFQDLAVVPVVVVTPLLAAGGGSAALIKAISLAAVKGALALAGITLSGKFFLEPSFRFVAKSQSQEAFVALILFTVLATSTLTEVLGLSDTLGAFLAGVMLAETTYQHQVEADIKPFRGLLLGLFFITVGFSIDLQLALANAGVVASLVGGLLCLKAGIMIALMVVRGRGFPTALRTGLLLSQGGEFAFVVLGLAQRVGVIPLDLTQLLMLVVALSMALTPALDKLGGQIASAMEKRKGLVETRADVQTKDSGDFVVVTGFGRLGQSVCELLDSKLVRYVAFDQSPARVIEAKGKGLPVYYGDGCRPDVLRATGVANAAAIVITNNDPEASLRAISALREAFPQSKIFCRAPDLKSQKQLKQAGADAIVPELLEASLLLGGAVLLSFGTPVEEVNSLIDEQRENAFVEAGAERSPFFGMKIKQPSQIQQQDQVQQLVDKDGTVIVDQNEGELDTDELMDITGKPLAA